jgi:hypothetical protein
MQCHLDVLVRIWFQISVHWLEFQVVSTHEARFEEFKFELLCFTQVIKYNKSVGRLTCFELTEIYGLTKLKYHIDTTPLEALNSNNYDFRVFEIQNPEGTLGPNEIQYVYTLFRPLEAKEYAVDLPIKINDIEGPVPNQHVLKIRGQGYHPEFVTEMP